MSVSKAEPYNRVTDKITTTSTAPVELKGYTPNYVDWGSKYNGACYVSTDNATWVQAEQGSGFLSRFYKARNLIWILQALGDSMPSYEEADNDLEKYFAFIYPSFEDAIELYDGLRFMLDVWRMIDARCFPPLINKPSSRLKALQKLNESFGALT